MADLDQRSMNGKRLPEVLIDSSLISTIASIVGMVLAIIGLGGIQIYWMATSATITQWKRPQGSRSSRAGMRVWKGSMIGDSSSFDTDPDWIIFTPPPLINGIVKK